MASESQLQGHGRELYTAADVRPVDRAALITPAEEK